MTTTAGTTIAIPRPPDSRTILFPLTMVTAAFAPTETMPAWLGTIAELNPLTATIYATRDLFGNAGLGADTFVAQNALLLAVLWPIALVTITAPLAVALPDAVELTRS
jgi:ABC-2 type transport system permease protein